MEVLADLLTRLATALDADGALRHGAPVVVAVSGSCPGRHCDTARPLAPAGDVDPGVLTRGWVTPPPGSVASLTDAHGD